MATQRIQGITLNSGARKNAKSSKNKKVTNVPSKVTRASDGGNDYFEFKYDGKTVTVTKSGSRDLSVEYTAEAAARTLANEIVPVLMGAG